MDRVARTDSASGVKPVPDRYSEGELIAQKYRLLKRLGQGGMGEVWLAENRALGSHVAIKLVSAEFEPLEISEASLGERLLEEARASAGLDHPAIVRVFDFGRTRRGDPMIVMEYLEGKDLATALATHGPPSPVRAVRTILPIIHGLAVVHDRGIVHRDIKPGNIFLCKRETGQIQPKLVDFGIARHEQRGNHRLTLHGTVLGSPDYMSPEQARGLEASVESDVWSVCAVLYELVTGQLPFAPTETYVNTDVPPPKFRDFDGAEMLWSLVARGLELDPSERWRSMNELGRALASWALDRGARDDISGVRLESTWFAELGSGATFVSLIPPEPITESEDAPESGVQPRTDEPLRGRDPLEVLADLHRGGDPVELMLRQRRRTVLVTFFIAAVLSIGFVLFVVFGSGAIAH